MNVSRFWMLVLVFSVSAGPLNAQSRRTEVTANAPTTLQLQDSIESVERRLEESQRLIRQLQEEIERLKNSPLRTPPAHYEVDDEQINKAVEARLARYETAKLVAAAAEARKWDAGYDKGFFIRPVEGLDAIPYDLIIKGRMQFRHTGFKSDDENFLKDVNDFEIERGRLIFQGHFIDPKLTYFINLDADTDDNHDVKFHDFWITYAFSDALNISAGRRKVSASRDWLQGSNRLRFTDRSMATTFFRPDRTVGVWLHGKPVKDVYYEVMVGNGFATADLTPSQVDDQFVFAATNYWDVMGDYGSGFSDLKCHEELAVRVGHSLAFTDMDPTTAPGEQRAFRLVDSGTRIVDAFPGATRGFDVWMYSVDAAMKYLGFSVNAEWFARWVQDFEASVGTPTGDLFDYGFVAEAGYFIVPETVELIGRISRVNSDGGSPSADEYAAGFNYFVKGHDMKLTFDVSVLNGAPTSNSSPNYLAGMDGVMFRTQLETGF